MKMDQMTDHHGNSSVPFMSDNSNICQQDVTCTFLINLPRGIRMMHAWLLTRSFMPTQGIWFKQFALLKFNKESTNKAIQLYIKIKQEPSGDTDFIPTDIKHKISTVLLDLVTQCLHDWTGQAEPLPKLLYAQVDDLAISSLGLPASAWPVHHRSTIQCLLTRVRAFLIRYDFVLSATEIVQHHLNTSNALQNCENIEMFLTDFFSCELSN